MFHIGKVRYLEVRSAKKKLKQKMFELLRNMVGVCYLQCSLERFLTSRPY